MKRAMTDTAKAMRAQEILDAAIALYQDASFEEIKMIDIAKKANVSKGTLFNYYKSKESLFMEILFIEYDKRFSGMKKRILGYDSMDEKDFRKFILDELKSILDENSVYMRLSAIKNSILEKNVDYDMIVKDKKDLYENGMQIAYELAKRFNRFTPEEFMDFFMAQTAITMGVLSMSKTPEPLMRGMEEHALTSFKIDFQDKTLELMETFMDGYFSI